MAGGDTRKIDAPLIEKAARKDDPLAKELVAETARYLAMGFGNLINIFNPESIVVGGGLSKMGQILLTPAFKQAADWCYEDAYEETRFAQAELGENSGVLGAAVYARKMMI
jgi:glucokinase